MRDAFLARVLVHFVALGHGIGQQVCRPLEMGVLHQPVSQVEQVAVAQPKLFAEAEGALPLEEAPQYHDDGAARPPCGLERCACEYVEKRAAGIASELGDGLSGVLVGMTLVATAFWAGQLTIVEKIQQPFITLLLVHQVFYRENHSVCFPAKLMLQPEGNMSESFLLQTIENRGGRTQ